MSGERVPDHVPLRRLVSGLGGALGQPDAAVLGVPVALDLRWRRDNRGLFLSGVPTDLVGQVGAAFAATFHEGAGVVAEWWSTARGRGVGTGPVLVGAEAGDLHCVIAHKLDRDESTRLEQAQALRGQFATTAARLESSLSEPLDAGVLLAALDGEPAAAAAVLDDVADSRRLVGRYLLDAADELDDERVDQLGDGYVRTGELWAMLAARRDPDLVEQLVELERSCLEWMLGAAAPSDALRVLIMAGSGSGGDASDFTSQVVIVTGASKGIGRAIAHGFGHQGARVVVSSRDQERCDAVVDELRAGGTGAIAVAAHMGNPDDVDALFAATLAEFGQVDILVNNAATNPLVAPLMEMPDDLVAKLFAVNVFGPLQLARLAARDMAQRGHGAILNIASRSAFAPEPNLGAYAASKAALVTLSKAMALEWASLGVRVNTIAPGPFATPMVTGLFEQDDYREAMLAGMAQHRIAEPEEIVGAALFLTGPDATFVTGAVLTVDGGMLP